MPNDEAVRNEEMAVRTMKLIDSFKGLPGEFYMLKGVLCEQIEQATKDRRYSTVMIAERMDKLTQGVGGMYVAA